jgi:hypothetical protein
VGARVTAGITLSCDGTRHGQPCRGFLPTRAVDPLEARTLAAAAGWRSTLDAAPGRIGDLCPACTRYPDLS